MLRQRLLLVLGLALGAVQSSCTPSNVCGDPEVVCRAQCGGGAEKNICYKDRTCTGGEWVCFCRACGFDFGVQDLAPADQSLPQDFSSVD